MKCVSMLRLYCVAVGLSPRKNGKLPPCHKFFFPSPGLQLPSPERAVPCYGRFVNELSIGVRRAALDIDNCGREEASVVSRCFCGGAVDVVLLLSLLSLSRFFRRLLVTAVPTHDHHRHIRLVG